MNALVINRSGGTVKGVPDALERLRAHAHAIDPGAQLFECEPDEVANTVHYAVARGAVTVAVCGGDGTLGAAAGVLVGTEVALGVIPGGTMNHFAHDVGIPLAWDQAIACAFRGSVRSVDVGVVNGRVFLNNVSIGVYPAVLEARAGKERDNIPRWMAMSAAVDEVWNAMPVEELCLSVDGCARAEIATPMLFIGNNRYILTLDAIGRRARLTDGVLHVCIATVHSQIALLGETLRALLLGPQASPGLTVFDAHTIDIERNDGFVAAGIDGERSELASPLRIACRPGALRIRTK